MIFTLGNKRLQRAVLYMLTAVCLLGMSCAAAQGQTTLIVGLKGMTADGAGGWRTLSINGRFDVVAADGSVLGRVTANPSPEQVAQGATDSIALSQAEGISLVPVAEDFQGAFSCEGSFPVALTADEANDVTVPAFARQGLFVVRNTVADTGAPAVNAEFMVLDAAGEMKLSFATDENGSYTARAALPNGEYKLVQMRAAQGTLPQENPLSFALSTYMGRPEDMAQLNVQNQPIPVQNANMSRLSAQVSPPAADGELASVTLNGLCEGDNTLSLRDFMLTIFPARLLGKEGGALQGGANVGVARVTASWEDSSVAVSVQPLDKQGKPQGQTVRAVAGESVLLENAAGVAVRYENAQTGDALIPTGFQAGSVQLELNCEREAVLPTEPSAYRAVMDALVSYTYEYPDTDGASLVNAPSACKPVGMEVALPDGKAALTVTGTAEGSNTLLLSATSMEAVALERTTPVAAVLPEGARVDESALSQEMRLLRTQAADIVVVELWQVTEATLSIPMKNGVPQSVELLVRDPKTLPVTLDEPEGEAIRALEHRKHPVLDALLLQRNGWYAAIPCAVEGGATPSEGLGDFSAVADGVMFEDINQNGSRSENEPAAAGQGIVLVGEQSGIAYGAVTGEDGTFTIFAPVSSTDQTVALQTLLPDNTLSVESRENGSMSRKGLAVPAIGVSAGYVRMSKLAGTVSLDGTHPMKDVVLTLAQAGETVATAQTDAAGGFALDGLAEGEYSLTLALPQEAAAAFIAQEGVSLSEDRRALTASVKLGYGETKELALIAEKLYTLKFGAMVQDNGIGGATMTLVDAAGSETTQTTDDSGLCLFTNLRAGEYTLRLNASANYVLTARNEEKIEPAQGYEMAVQIGAEMSADTVFMLEPTATVTGRISSLGADQTLTAASVYAQVTAETGADGSFRFEGLAAGEYTIYAPLTKGRTLPLDTQWQVSSRGDMVWQTVTVEAGGAYELPQVEYLVLTSIRGVAYMDQDGDLTYREGEQLMSGVTVLLLRLQDGAWTEVSATKTDEYGAYLFRDLQEGQYRIASAAEARGVYVASVGASAISLGREGLMATEALDVAEGDQIAKGCDIALAKPSSLRFAAFSDSNENGTRGEYERPIANVRVEVMNGDAVLSSGTTDTNGEAVLTGIPTGSHTLRVTLPDGYLFTGKGEGMGIGVSCVEGEKSTAISEAIVFVGGEEVSAAAGAIPVGSFAGRVWMDENNNGIMDEGEPGAPGVTVSLKGVKSGNVYTLVTDNTGEYRFANLRNEVYTLSAELPDGMLFARYAQTGGDLRSVFTVAGKVAGRQFPVSGAENVSHKNIGVVKTGIVQGQTFLDLNYNGVRDEGEPGYGNVMVEIIKASNNTSMGKMTTQEDGQYRFEGLRAGEYRLRAILPDDGSVFTRVPGSRDVNSNLFEARDGRRENSIAPVTIGNGGTAETVVGLALGATIQGTVFMDADYDGILNDKEKKVSGVKVELRDEQGNVVVNDTTNANGNYTLQGIMPGEYRVYFLRKDGYAFTRLRNAQDGGSWVRALKGEQGESEAIVTEMGQQIAGVNAGMLPSSTMAGVFFQDLNDNGLRDEGENGMEGVTVRLYSEDAETDLSMEITPEGTYFFDGVMPGEYTLSFILPEHAELAKVMENGNVLEGKGQTTSTAPFTVEMGKTYTYPMVGGVTLGTFEGVLYHDVNANGVRDEGEEPVSGVEIVLTPSRGDLEEAKTVSDGQGAFSISGLRPDAYRITLTLPEGMIFSAPLVSAGLALETLQTQTLDCPHSALISRESYAIGAVKPATIQGNLWLDENRDAARGEQEAPVVGLRVELVDEKTGKTVKTSPSAEDGTFAFAQVRPGSYRVQYKLPDQSEPANEPDATVRMENGKMTQGGIQVAEGQTYDQIHAGMVSRTVIAGTLSLNEGGTQTLLPDVEVRLYREGDAAPLAAVKTDAIGTYRFDGLWPDCYVLEAQLPDGMLFLRAAEGQAESAITQYAGGKYGKSDGFELKMAQHRTKENILYVKPGRVGDMAWLDLNQNGLIDSGEPGIPGMTIMLMQNGEVIANTQTNAYGYYLFDAVYPGTYSLAARAYPELGITKMVPELRLISSCLSSGDGDSAQSDAFEVVSGMAHYDNDLGYILREGQSMPSAIVPPPSQDWSVKYAPVETTEP